jgi:Ser/Thr protein kinase RdoA (MazF antagonist)
VAALVTALGLPAPRFLGSERIDGRVALVYERVSGPSMLDALTRRPWQVDRLAGELATLHASMHEASGAGLPRLKSEIRRRIEWAAGTFDGFPAERVLARLDDLPDGGVVCHGDMHPGNVILTPSGPTVIDWMTAASGPPEADIARTRHLLVGSDVPDAYPRLPALLIGRLRRRFASSYLRAYRRHGPIDDDQLRRWRLPVLAARLSERIEEERAFLLTAIDEELGEA